MVEYRTRTWTSSRRAQLQVVLPGTRASFRRRVIDAMSDLVGATRRLLLLRQGRRAGVRRRDARRRRLDRGRSVERAASRLSAAFGFDPKSVVAAPRRAYVSAELWPESERAAPAVLSRTRRCPTGFVHALLLFLHEGGVLFGLAGLERRAGEGPFDEADTARLEELAPFVVAGARAQLQYDELSREAAALRALGKVERRRLRRRPRPQARRLGGRPRARHRLGGGRRADRGAAGRRCRAVAHRARARRRATDAAAAADRQGRSPSVAPRGRPGVRRRALRGRPRRGAEEARRPSRA